jgi:DNA-binding transcriptional regulator LsrR (DeoR family)
MALKQRFQLQHLILVPQQAAANPAAQNQALALATAKYLKRLIRPHAVVGFAWGSALAKMVSQLQQPVQTAAILSH